MTDEFLEFKHRSGITISIPKALPKEERDQALADAKVYVSVRLWDLDQQNEINNKPLSSTDPYDERLSDKRKSSWTKERRKAMSDTMMKKHIHRGGSRAASKGLFLK